MIVDITGIELTPGNDGKYCKGNGEHFDEQGILIECVVMNVTISSAVHLIIINVTNAQILLVQGKHINFCTDS